MKRDTPDTITISRALARLSASLTAESRGLDRYRRVQQGGESVSADAMLTRIDRAADVMLGDPIVKA